MLLKLILILFFSISFAVSEKYKFMNYSLYKILPKNYNEVKLIQELKENNDKYDFWSYPTANSNIATVLSSPENKNDLENFLKQNNMEYDIALQNIQEIIDKEIVKLYTRSNMKTMEWNAYYPLEDIYSWLEDLAETYPEVSIIVAGKSYEGREIKGVKISHGSRKKAIFIEGGLHAREWISPAVVNYITNELITSNDEEAKAAARDYDWYIFPVTNPDGYVWSHTDNRLWRKNRQPYGSEYGVDLNRNWNSNWLIESASVDPSSNNFAGLGPFSEPETRTLSTYIRSLSDDMVLYLSFHSAGQLLLVPYGNTTEPLDNYYDAVSAI